MNPKILKFTSCIAERRAVSTNIYMGTKVYENFREETECGQSANVR